MICADCSIPFFVHSVCIQVLQEAMTALLCIDETLAQYQAGLNQEVRE